MHSHPTRPPMKPLAHPLSVLVADDDLFAQRLTITMLRQLGHSGVVVADGRRALDVLGERRFDLVLLDVSMPVLDGVAALAALRQAESLHPLARPQCVVMMTAYADADTEQRLHAAGATGVIFKPFDPLQFRCELQRIRQSAALLSSHPHQECPQ